LEAILRLQDIPTGVSNSNFWNYELPEFGIQQNNIQLGSEAEAEAEQNTLKTYKINV